MKITLESAATGQSAIVACSGEDLTIEEVVDNLIRPVLLAYGYQPESVDGIFKV